MQPAPQVQILGRSKASSMSVPQIDFFYIQEIVRGFALSHYFNIFSHTLKKQISKDIF